jgi:hypothetical protein
VITAQSPRDYRLLTYRVGFWEKQPDPEDRPKVYQCPVSGADVFALKVALDQKVDLASVQSLAINHFMSLVLSKRPYRKADDALGQLLSTNKAPWTFVTPDGMTTYSVFDVQHLQNFRAVDGENLGMLYSVTSYQATVIDSRHATDITWNKVDFTALPRRQFSSLFEDPTVMVTMASTDFASPATFNEFVTAARNQLAGK